MLDHLRREHEVECSVAERERLEVRLPELGPRDACARGLEDPLGDVGAGDSLRQVGLQRREVAAVAAAGIEEGLAREELADDGADPGELPVDPRIGRGEGSAYCWAARAS